MTKPRATSVARIENYLPVKGAHALVKPPQWKRVQKLVKEAVLPFASLHDVAVRSYLKAMLLLAMWADDNGYALQLDVVLSENLIWAFVKQQPFGAFDYEPHLWRLAAAHHTVSAAATNRSQIARPRYLAPYSDDELTQLISFASDLTNQHRRETLLAIIVLGTGCAASPPSPFTATEARRSSRVSTSARKSQRTSCRYCARWRRSGPKGRSSEPAAPT